MKVSLKTIAKELNLSKTTVSWVLQGKGDKNKISAKTQALVMDYAQEHNYSPNLLAKSLSEGISNTIGLIIPSIEDTFYSQLARAIEIEADKFGCLLMFCSSGRDAKREQQMIQTLKDRRVDGIIIAPTEQHSTAIERLVQDSFPLVVIDLLYQDFTANSVIIDNEAAAFQLVQRMIKQGARKIAFLATATHLNAITQRYAGYQKAHQQAGLLCSEKLYKNIPLENYQEEIGGILDELFQSNPNLDGIFFATHFLANEGLNYLKLKDKDINQYHLASMHEMPHFKAFAPKMNIAQLPTQTISYEVVRKLMSQITKTDLEKKVHVVPTQLLIRDTN